MARFQLSSLGVGVLQDNEGRARPGVSFTTTAPLYAAATGSTQLAGAELITDNAGRAPGWLDPDTDAGAYTISYGGGTSLTFGVGDPNVELIREAPLNLEDERFGAVNGAADNTAAIQEWYDFGATATRPEFYAPGGLWITNGNLMPSQKATVRGAGAGVTVFKLKDNAPVLAGMPHEHRAVLSHKDGLVGFADLTIADLEIDGNVANNSSSEFIFGIETWGGSRLTIRDVYAHDIRGDGILLAAATTSSIETADATVENIRLDNCGFVVGGIGNARMGIAVIYALRPTIRNIKATRIAGYVVDLEADNLSQAIRDGLVEDVSGYDVFGGVNVYAVTGGIADNNTVRHVALRDGATTVLTRAVVLENTTNSTVDDVKPNLGSSTVLLVGTNTNYRIRNTPGESCLLSRTAGQNNILTGIPTVLEWDSEREDSDSMHDPATATTRQRITAIVPGLYAATVNLRWSSTAGSYRQVNGRVNGTGAYAISRQPAALAFQSHSLRAVRLAAGDYVDFVVEHDAGVSIDLVKDADYAPEVSLVKVG